MEIKEELQSILDNYTEQLDRHQKELEELEKRMDFYSEHNLQEELRISLERYSIANMVVYRWGKMCKEIRDLLQNCEIQ